MYQEYMNVFDNVENRMDLPAKLTSSRRLILTGVRRNKLTTYFQY